MVKRRKESFGQGMRAFSGTSNRRDMTPYYGGWQLEYVHDLDESLSPCRLVDGMYLPASGFDLLFLSVNILWNGKVINRPF